MESFVQGALLMISRFGIRKLDFIYAFAATIWKQVYFEQALNLEK